MATRITIPVSVTDETRSGLQTIEQQMASLQARQKAAQEAFVRANAEAFVNAEHEAYERVAAEFAALKAQQARDAERLQAKLAPVQGPLTPEQHAAGEEAKAIAKEQTFRNEIRQQADAQVADEREKAQQNIAVIREQQAAAAKLREEITRYNDQVKRAAEASHQLADGLEQIDFPDGEYEQVRQLYNEIDKTRQASELAAQSFEKLGQVNAAARLRKGLDDTADSARRLKTAMDAAGVRQLANDMNAAGNAARSTAVDIGAAQREANLAAAGFTKVGNAARQAAGSRSASGQGVLQLAYAVDDMQYGLKGVVNNIPMLVQGLGATAAAAGKLAILAVVISQIVSHWDELQKLLSNPHAIGIAVEHASKKMEEFRLSAEDALRSAKSSVVSFANSWGLLPDSLKKYSDAQTEAIGQERLAADRLAKENAKHEAAAKANAEASEAATKRQWQNELSQMSEGEDAIAKLTAKAKELQNAINAPTQKGFLPLTPAEIEARSKKLIEVEDALNRVTLAKTKADRTRDDAATEAAHKRELDFYHSQLKSIEQIEAELARIAELKRGTSTGVAGAHDLDEKSAKRLHAAEESLKNKLAEARKAAFERGVENYRQAEEFSQKLDEHAEKLERQLKLENALHDIEKRRQAIQTGSDDPTAEAKRQQNQANREAFLDRVKQKTEQAKQLADEAANNESLTEAQRKQRRDEYYAAVQNQITAEANARKQSLQEQIKLDAERAEQSAALDREALELKRQEALAADAEYRRAREADAIADADHRAGAEERRRKATQDLAEAQAAKQRAEDELARQIDRNEQARRDLADKNQQAHTKQRIADEIAVGKARERALLDAAAMEQQIEAARQAKAAGQIAAEPRVKEAAAAVANRIDDRDVRLAAIRNKQDAAEQQFRDEQAKLGKAVKDKDVREVRRKAGVEFAEDMKDGKANAELARQKNKLFQKAVDDAAGLTDDQRAALKKLGDDEVARIEQQQELANNVNDIERAKLVDPRVQARLKAKEKAKAAAEKRKAVAEQAAKDRQAKLQEEAAARKQAEKEANDKEVADHNQKVDERDEDEQFRKEWAQRHDEKLAAEFRAEQAKRAKAAAEKRKQEDALAEVRRREEQRRREQEESELAKQVEANSINDTKLDTLRKEHAQKLQRFSELQQNAGKPSERGFAADLQEAQDLKDRVNELATQIEAIEKWQADSADLAFRKSLPVSQSPISQPPAMPPLKPDTVTIDAEADTATAERELSDLTKPRTVTVKAVVESEKLDVPRPIRTPDVQNGKPRRREPEFADGPRPQREAPLFFDTLDAPQPIEPPAAAPQQSNATPVTQAVRTVAGAAQQVASTDSAIIDGFQQIAASFTALRNEQLQTADVIAQIISHINREGSQYLAQLDTTRMRSVRAGA